MNRLTDIQERQAAIRARLLDLQAISGPEDEEGEAAESARAAYTAATAEIDGLLAEWDKLESERLPLQKRADSIAAIRNVPTQGGTTERGAFQAPTVITRQDPFAVLEDGSLHGSARTRALVDAGLRANENMIDGAGEQAYFETILKRHASDHRWAENILGRSRPEYYTGFSKLMTGQASLMDESERAAIAIGTSTQGGALVPTALDPTIILTNTGTSNVMRQHASVRTLVDGNVWYGVTSAGSTASWDAELAEVSDDSPSVAAASITCYKAQNFIQAGLEALQDIAGLQSDVLMLFADAKDRLEGAAHMTGSGSAPQGLFTLVCASTTLRTTSTTAATIGLVDLNAVYVALPARWRGKSTWVMNPTYSAAVKALGTAIGASYSGNLTDGLTTAILDRPVVSSDDAPSTQTTTVLDQEIVLADLSQYIIVDKPGGFSVQYIPALFNTSNNLPDGRVGWYATWRTGAGMPALAAGRWLADKTSA